MADTSFKYRAFISYSHADHEWAAWLHRALERYRVPKRLAGVDGVTRLGKCFRDEEELSAAAELGPKITDALKTSDALIVVCSPRAAKSQWVNQEIEAFKQSGREGRVFALIVEGEPYGGADAECFPPALTKTATGAVAEPLAVDVRKFGRDDAVLRLVGGILDVGYDDLRQREARKRRNELLRAQALFVSGLVLVVAALAGGYFAASNYVDVKELRAEQLALSSEQLASEGQYAEAMLMAVAGDPAGQAGVLEKWFRPDGYQQALAAMGQAWAQNMLVSTRAAPVPFKPDSIVEISDDGKLAAVSDYLGPVTVWEIATGKVVMKQTARDRWVRAMAFSAEGKVLAAENDIGEVYVWRVGDTGPGRKFETGGAGDLLALSPDGDLLVAGGNDEVLVWSLAQPDNPPVHLTHIVQPTWEFETMKDIPRSPRPAVPWQIAISPDGTRVAVGYRRGLVAWWWLRAPTEAQDAAAFQIGGEPVKVLAGPDADVTGLAWSHFGNGLAVRYENGEVRRWNSTQPNQQWSNYEFSSRPEQFSSDNRLLLSGPGTEIAALWRSDSAAPELTFAGHAQPLLAARLVKDDAQLVTIDAAGIIKTWAPRFGGSAAVLPRGDSILSGVFVADRDRMLVGRTDESVALEAAFGQRIKHKAYFVGGPPISVALARESERFAVATSSSTVELWTLDGTVALRSFATDEGQTGGVAISDDGRSLVSGGHVATLWRDDSDQPVETFELPATYTSSVALSPDGKRVAVGFVDGRIALWDVGEKQPKHVYPAISGAVTLLMFAPNGEALLVGNSAGQSSVLQIGDGRLLQYLGEKPGDGVPALAAFSSDGKYLAIATSGGAVTLFRVGSERPVQSFPATGDDRVMAIAFRDSDREIVVASAAKVPRVLAIDPFVLAAPAQRVVMACKKLQSIGVDAFTVRQMQRFRALRDLMLPCADATAAPAN